jgi:GNAT superfamily N-acetyltransferase
MDQVERDEISIRAATPDDLETILYQRMAMFRAMGFREPAVLDSIRRDSIEYLRDALKQGSYRGWFAVTASGAVAAGCGVLIAAWPGGPWDGQARRAWVLNVYSEPAYRRRGLARQLMQVAIDWARSEGFRILSLHASREGRPLYQSLGFEPTNEMRLRLE